MRRGPDPPTWSDRLGANAEAETRPKLAGWARLKVVWCKSIGLRGVINPESLCHGFAKGRPLWLQGALIRLVLPLDFRLRGSGA